MKKQNTYALVLDEKMLFAIQRFLRWEFEDYDTCLDKESATFALACGDACVAITAALHDKQRVIDIRKEKSL